MLVIELCDGNISNGSVDALIPIVERLQRHDAVDQYDGGQDDGSRVAAFPWNHIDELKQARQQDLDPDEATQAPHAGKRRACASPGQYRDGIGHAE